MQINARTRRSPSAHIKHTLRLTWRFLSPSPSLESVARQWKHWEAVSMAWPGLLFDWKTYAFYMLQLWFYQIAVKHTNHAPSFVPSLTVCTVPRGAVTRCVCMFAHGGSIISQAGLRPRWRKNSQLGRKAKARPSLLLHSNKFWMHKWISTSALLLLFLTNTFSFSPDHHWVGCWTQKGPYQGDLRHVQLSRLLWLELCAPTKETKKDTADLNYHWLSSRLARLPFSVKVTSTLPVISQECYQN